MVHPHILYRVKKSIPFTCHGSSANFAFFPPMIRLLNARCLVTPHSSSLWTGGSPLPPASDAPLLDRIRDPGIVFKLMESTLRPVSAKPVSWNMKIRIVWRFLKQTSSVKKPLLSTLKSIVGMLRLPVILFQELRAKLLLKTKKTFMSICLWIECRISASAPGNVSPALHMYYVT